MNEGEATGSPRDSTRWLNGTVLAIGLGSLFSDWSHEIATTLLPVFLSAMGAAAAWLGLIEGLADGLSSFAKMASGFYTDRLVRRKPIAVWGYLVTALATAAIGSSRAAWHVLVARSVAWLGRGVRTPVRKALLAAAVTPNTYGRAFGFERMMDTLGAIVGPASALALLRLTGSRFPYMFAWTLVPGLIAAAVIHLGVQERKRTAVPYVSFRDSVRSLPHSFRKYILAVGVFGMGDFAHTMLILLATQRLAISGGKARAAGIAAGLYLLHNVLYAGSSFWAGWLADRVEKRYVLAGGYALAGVMALGIVVLPATVANLALVFVLGGIYIGIEETLEDSLCAELVDKTNHGMAFGSLATVNGIGDFASSLIVGLLWSRFGTEVAFGYSAVLFFTGSCLVMQLKSGPRQ